MRKVTKKGFEDWDDLVGKEISFDWQDGWEDYPWEERGVLQGTQPYSEDPRYPRYYVLMHDGGVSFWETDSVEVTVHD